MKKVEDRLPLNLYNFFQANTMTGVVSTLDEDGYPRGAPMSLFYAPNDKTLLMGSQNRSQTFLNAVRIGKIALTFINEGDLVFTIIGQVRVLKNAMECNKHVGVLAVDIVSIKSNVAVDVEVSEGIKYNYRSPKWENFVNSMLEELRSFTADDLKN